MSLYNRDACTGRVVRECVEWGEMTHHSLRSWDSYIPEGDHRKTFGFTLYCEGALLSSLYHFSSHPPERNPVEIRAGDPDMCIAFLIRGGGGTLSSESQAGKCLSVLSLAHIQSGPCFKTHISLTGFSQQIPHASVCVFMALEAGIPRSRCWQICILLKPVSLFGAHGLLQVYIPLCHLECLKLFLQGPQSDIIRTHLMGSL